jgi:hypothetical protein
MANVKLSFYGSNFSKTTEHKLECYANADDEIYISIEMDGNNDFFSAFISLDKETAIKLSRELRKQISLI